MIPEDASSNQVFDMKAAFWGGAYITMQTYQLATEAVKNGKMDLAIKLVKDMERDIKAMMEALSNDQV